MLRRLPAGYLVEVVSHRLLRYSSGVLHLLLLGSSLLLVASGAVYLLVLAAQLAFVAAALAGVSIARYYALVTWATAGPRQLPPPWRPRHLGGRGGDALAAVNRAADVAIAGLGLAVTSPLLAAAALAVKLEDRGPVFFRQTRVGKDGRDFELLKLRTMVVGAERKGAGYAVDKGDSRITASAGCCGARRSTSCRSSETCSAARCPSSGDRRCATRSSATPTTSADVSTCALVSPAGRR